MKMLDGSITQASTLTVSANNLARYAHVSAIIKFMRN
jgi:hypothetical protein